MEDGRSIGLGSHQNQAISSDLVAAVCRAGFCSHTIAP